MSLSFKLKISCFEHHFSYRDMKTIRFESQNEKEKEFAREVRKRVKTYFKENNISVNANLSMYLKTVIMLALYLVPFIILLTVNMPLVVAWLMTVLIGVGEAGVGMSVMHDAAHGAYSSKTWVNNLFASTMTLLGSNTYNWKLQHNINHHTFTNIFNYDPDISTKAVIRLCDHAPLKKYHRFQQYYAFWLYGLLTLLKFFGDFVELIKSNKAGTTKELKGSPVHEMVRLIIIKVAYLAIILGLPILFTDFSFWQILIGFITLHIVAGMIMSTVFQMAHVVEGTYQPLPGEDNTIYTEWMLHELMATSDFGRNNGLLSWYIGGLDFQIEHHLFPNICHVHYKEIAPIIEKVSKEFGYSYNLKPTFGHALASHFRRLKQLGRDSK